MNIRPRTLLVLFALGALAGCAQPTAPYGLQSTTKYTLENTEKFVTLDAMSQIRVACTGLQERTLPDGRLQVLANVKNRIRGSVVVQVQCVFFDDRGLAVGGETPWRTLYLPEDSTEAVRFTAFAALATHYTIRVREPR
jgi:Protein of unknown function (DUF1425)